MGFEDFSLPLAMAHGEMPAIVAGFRAGARHAIAAGFEVHGAHGDLLDDLLAKKDAPPTGFDHGALKAAFGGPDMADLNDDQAGAAAAIAAGHVDLVAFGKLFISDPDL